MERCLYCYQPLHEGEKDYHARCAKRFFGQAQAPILPYTRKDINQLAQVVVESRTTVTGVQAKLSMDLEHDANGRAQRLTIVGVMGRYLPLRRISLHTQSPPQPVSHTPCRRYSQVRTRSAVHCNKRSHQPSRCSESCS